MTNYILEFFVSTIAAIGFGLVFSIPLKILLVSGLNGGLGWLIYKIILNKFDSIYVATFVSALVIAVLSEILAKKLRYPASIFNFPGIINLCPGEAIYNTMYYFINGQREIAIASFYKALVIAGAIAFGVLLASSFSQSLKTHNLRPTKRTNYKEILWKKKYI